MTALPLPMSAPLPMPISPAHPAFAGHFPGHPILPGVVLLDEAVQGLAAAERLDVTALDVTVAKFLSPVRPGEALSLSYKCVAPMRYAVEVHVQGADEGQGPGPPRLAATATITVQGEPSQDKG